MNYKNLTPFRILSELRPNYPLKPTNHTELWSRIARRKHRYNRMDPNPDPQSRDASPTTPEPINPKPDESAKYRLTKEDWRKFWVERLRKMVDAPHLTDKDLVDALDRSKRIFLRQREENRKVHIDPDLPACYYWNKYEVADWMGSVDFPLASKVKEMFLHFGICGRHLVTLDANQLLKMGLYDLETIKKVTSSIRKILGLPHKTNGFRPIARVAPLETFLKLKVRTGPSTDKYTFKEFCENQKLEHEPLQKQMADGYQPIPSCCRVEIRPDKDSDVKWIPVTVQGRKSASGSSDNSFTDSSRVTSNSSDSLLYDVPTVEELVTNAALRNTFIPQILNDIVTAVFEKVSENRKLNKEQFQNKQRIADDVMRNSLDKAFSEFRITDPEDKLKFITIIAEELVEDVLRAREILEDIDKVEEKIRTEMSKEDMASLQQAVSHYVQNVMTVIVPSALREMEESSLYLRAGLNKENGNEPRNIYDDAGSDSSSLLYQAVSGETDREDEEMGAGAEFEVVWDRTFNDDPVSLATL